MHAYLLHVSHTSTVEDIRGPQNKDSMISQQREVSVSGKSVASSAHAMSQKIMDGSWCFNLLTKGQSCNLQKSISSIIYPTWWFHHISSSCFLHLLTHSWLPGLALFTPKSRGGLDPPHEIRAEVNGLFGVSGDQVLHQRLTREDLGTWSEWSNHVQNHVHSVRLVGRIWHQLGI